MRPKLLEEPLKVSSHTCRQRNVHGKWEILHSWSTTEQILLLSTASSTMPLDSVLNKQHFAPRKENK